MNSKLVTELLGTLPEDKRAEVIEGVLFQLALYELREQILDDTSSNADLEGTIDRFVAEAATEATPRRVARAALPRKKQWNKLTKEEKLQILHHYKNDFEGVAGAYKSHKNTIYAFAKRHEDALLASH